ncbi:MAG TPA: flagellar motor protein [Vicinamibacterales bacterium]|nr:flagellar motor protein [Vicinamibacterales bacterium]
MSVKSDRWYPDVASLAGIAVAIGLVLLGQALEGGRVGSILQGTAAVIVFGGTLGAVLTSFSLADIVRAGRSLRDVFFARRNDADDTVERIVGYAQTARRQGIMAIENELDKEPNPFLRGGLMLAIDGASVADVRETLAVENEALLEYAERPARVYESAGGYAPTIGILGAVLGLINVMEHLTEPSRLGAGVATAFVATVYGVGAANLVLLPIAAKIRLRADRQARMRELAIDGVLAIQEGANPRLIEQKLRARFAAETAVRDAVPALPGRARRPAPLGPAFGVGESR